MFSRKSQKASAGAGPSTSSNPNKPWLAYGIILRSRTHQQRFLALCNRPIISTRWYDWAPLMRLGIDGDVAHLCDLLKLSGFIGMPKVPTSRRLTLEFLSTLEREEVQDENGMEYMQIRYQLMNHSFTDDYGKLNRLFGWPEDSPTSAMLAENQFEPGEIVDERDFDAQSVWTLLTNDLHFDARRSKSSHIIHPAIRYVHRLLVFSIWGRADLGAMSDKEMKCLWLMTNPLIDWDCPHPINYAENFIDRMIDLREGTVHKRDICMGGMVTHIALDRVPDFTLDKVDHVDQNFRLDWEALKRNKWISPLPQGGAIWKVGIGGNLWVRWLDLPNAEATSLVDPRLRDLNAYRQALKTPRLYAPSNEEREAAAAEAAAHPIPEAMAPPPPGPPSPPPPSQPFAPPSPSHDSTLGGEPSALGDVTLQSLADQFDQFRVSTEAFQRRQMQESDYQMTYLRGIYAAGVDSGAIRSPFLNYPLHPPQQGPIPGWHNRQETYPYHPHRPEGIDYRYPGGSDPRYDPNNPPFTTYPVYPPNYHSSVPPMEQTWGNAPMPQWGNYPNIPDYSSTMDEDD